MSHSLADTPRPSSTRLTMRRQSLRRNILALVATLFIGAAVTAALSSWYFVYRYEQAGWQDRQTEAARSAADKVALFVQNSQGMLDHVGLLDRQYLENDARVLDRLLRSEPALLELMRLDAAGHVFASAYRDAPLLANLFTIPQSNWFTQAAAGDSYLGGVQVSSNDEPYLILARPAPDGGVVAARLRMNLLWDVVARIHFGRTGRAYVVNRQGEIIAHTDPQVVLARQSIAAQPQFALLLQSGGENWYGAYLNVEGQREIGTLAPVAGTDWTLITELAEAEAYATSRAALAVLGGGMLVLGGLALGIARQLLRRQIFEPMEQLGTGAERIGQGDLNHRIKVVRRDEIGQVAEGFNYMAERLRHREIQLAARSQALAAEVDERKRAQAALQQANAALENRVAERTAEISQVNDRLRLELGERQQAEAQLRQAEAKFRTLVEQLPAITYIAALDEEQTLYVSPQIETVLGFTPQEWLADPGLWRRQIHPDDRERLFADDDHSHATGEAFSAEYRILTRDGRVVWFHDESRWVRDESGRPRFTQGIEFDITEHKRAEAALREAEAKYRALVERIPAAVYLWELGQNGACRYISPQVEAMLGFSVEEWLADPGLFFRQVHPEDRERTLAAEEHSQVSGEGLHSEFRMLTRDGRVVWIRDESVALPAEEGQVRSTQGLMFDISEHKRIEAALRESEERYALAVQGANDGLWDWNLEADQVYYSPRWKAMLGHAGEDIGSSPEAWFSRVHPDDLPRVRAEIAAHLERHTPHFESEYRLRHADGHYRWILSRGLALWNADGRAYRMAGSQSDITKRKQAEMLQEVVYQIAQATNQELSLNELVVTIHQSIQKVMLADNFYIALHDAETDRIGYLYVVDQYDEEVSLASSGKSMTAYVLHTGKSLLATEAVFQGLLDAGEVELVGTPSPIWLGVPLKIHGEVIGVMVVQDYQNEMAYGEREKQLLEYVSSQVAMSIQRKMAEERLLHDALHDALTGLPNRVLFMDRLEQTFERAKRHRSTLSAVLFVDLDRFKIVNDSLGHAVGDQLLIATARRIKACLRPEDTVARLGGDEFAILLDDIQDSSDTIRVAERIQKRLMSTAMLSGLEQAASASIGIALLTPSYERPGDVLRDADTAMYRAKAQGRARHQVFDADMHASAVNLLQLEADLRRAVDRQEWQIVYQPIVSLATGQITGAEALLRWRHPRRGVVAPLDFIAVAEDSGLILPIGEYVLRSACAQTRAWHAAGYPQLWVSVNISARQFQDQNLPQVIGRILAETGLPSRALKLEITESVAMKDLNHSVRVLNELSAMGVYVSIDDFGIGYSSLGYLKRFPLRVLKIDRSFIQDLPGNTDSEAITTAIIAMAHSLNLEVVAEGVETEDQAALLRGQACDAMQGYLFSRPLSVEALEQMLPRRLELAERVSLPVAA